MDLPRVKLIALRPYTNSARPAAGKREISLSNCEGPATMAVAGYDDPSRLPTARSWSTDLTLPNPFYVILSHGCA